MTEAPGLAWTATFSAKVGPIDANIDYRAGRDLSKEPIHGLRGPRGPEIQPPRMRKLNGLVEHRARLNRLVELKRMLCFALIVRRLSSLFILLKSSHVIKFFVLFFLLKGFFLDFKHVIY